MIIVALQMKNINHMYMTTWLVLHAAINLQAKQSKASGWQLHVASALSQPLIWSGSRNVKRWKRTLFYLCFEESIQGKTKEALSSVSFQKDIYIVIRSLPEKKLNAFVRS